MKNYYRKGRKKEMFPGMGRMANQRDAIFFLEYSLQQKVNEREKKEGPRRSVRSRVQKTFRDPPD